MKNPEASCALFATAYPPTGESRCSRALCEAIIEYRGGLPGAEVPYIKDPEHASCIAMKGVVEFLTAKSDFLSRLDAAEDQDFPPAANG